MVVLAAAPAGVTAVSYTHLDVYKRQALNAATASFCTIFISAFVILSLIHI